MVKIIWFFILSALAGVVLPASASQEGVLVFGTFKIASPGIGESGPVVVSGRQGMNGMEHLEVRAFGKVFTLKAEQLKELRGGLLNSVQLSYEKGYRNLGGRTIYLQLSKGFTSGVAEKALISIAESGTITVTREKTQ